MRESDRVDPVAMALERLQAGAAAGVPDLDGLIVRPRCYVLAVVREGD